MNLFLGFNFHGVNFNLSHESFRLCGRFDELRMQIGQFLLHHGHLRSHRNCQLSAANIQLTVDWQPSNV